MRSLRFILTIAGILYVVFAHAQRHKFNFNSEWKVYRGDDSSALQPGYNDASWQPVTLPCAWNEDEAFKKDIVDLSTGIAWYRKTFRLPASAKDQKIFIEFEGIRQAGTFYLNGKYIGRHENGVTAFGFDISGMAFTGDRDNVIAARIDNNWDYKELSSGVKFQWQDRNFNANYGGITKNVYLHIAPRIYQTLPLYSSLRTTGVYVYAGDYHIGKNKATVHVKTEVKNETAGDVVCTLQVKLEEMNGKPVRKFEGDAQLIKAGAVATLSGVAPVSGLHFWSWGYGYLYKVKSVLLINGKETDSVTTITGFRKTEFANGLFKLNDRAMMIHGYAQRTSNEWPAVGASVPAWLSDYSNGLMVEGNANLVRWMHITPSKQDIESCDRVGLLQAMPAGDAERDVNDGRWLQRKAVMTDAIIYNRNNPSIIFYECGNENISETHMREMKGIKALYDPFGGRAIGSREMLNSQEAEYGGEMLYINKSAGKPVWAMEYSRDEGLRKYWDDYSPPYHKDGEGPLYKGQNAAAYNRNQESHAIENLIRWYEYWKERPGTGKRVSSGGVNIIFSETNTHHRGAENYRRSGEVDALRIKKENFYANSIPWNGWADVEKHGIHIIGHWNYESQVTKDIYVIASGYKTGLWLNDEFLGWGDQQYRFLYRFKQIQFKPGVLKAVSYDEKGKEMAVTKLSTAGKPYAIRLTPILNPAGWKADGHDLALVEAEVVDKQGNRCPVAMNLIDYKLEGHASWRGGMAQGPDNYILSTSFPVECGVNRFLLRSTTTGGAVVVQAVSAGLQPATLRLQTKKIAVSNGLSKILPGAGLPSNLTRGATPLTPSFQMSRVALDAKPVAAGAFSDSLFYTVDDNERSDWHNDGQLSTAWAAYKLDSPALVSEVTLKLNNFRSRSYPLCIKLDGEVIFRDTTQKSLGYFTAICNAAKPGSVISIELYDVKTTAGTEAAPELNGKKLDDGVVRNDAGASGMLSIIEIEFYGKPKSINKNE